jgi:hypothetical protein
MEIKLSHDKLKKIIQTQIDSCLDYIRQESEDWGLGEMDELYEIDSIDKIVVDRIFTGYRDFEVYVNVYNNKPRNEYDNTINEIQHWLGDFFPNIVVFLDKIKKTEL